MTWQPKTTRRRRYPGRPEPFADDAAKDAWIAETLALAERLIEGRRQHPRNVKFHAWLVEQGLDRLLTSDRSRLMIMGADPALLREVLRRQYRPLRVSTIYLDAVAAGVRFDGWPGAGLRAFYAGRLDVIQRELSVGGDIARVCRLLQELAEVAALV